MGRDGLRNLKGFGGVGHFEEFGDGVPVAGGAGGLECLVKIGPIELGFAGTDREVNVEFPANQMEFFRIGLDLRKGDGGFARRLVCEKGDEKFAGFDAGTFGKWIPGNYAAEIGGSAEDYGRVKAEFALDGGFEFLGKLREIRFVRLEDDVAALDVSLGIAKLERDAKGAEGVHFDFVVAADVDAAEQADDGGHGWRGYYKDSDPGPSVCAGRAGDRRTARKAESKRTMRV